MILLLCFAAVCPAPVTRARSGWVVSSDSSLWEITRGKLGQTKKQTPNIAHPDIVDTGDKVESKDDTDVDYYSSPVAADGYRFGSDGTWVPLNGR